uniref:Uncharacterized protein n=1 Tax=Arundo donax TaxID=35708 RepID=A0A0A9DH68_ARUDO
MLLSYTIEVHYKQLRPELQQRALPKAVHRVAGGRGGGHGAQASAVRGRLQAVPDKDLKAAPERAPPCRWRGKSAPSPA